MSSNEPLTLRDLDGLALDRVRGVGTKKKEALESFGIGSVLDLLTTYPRRYVDRTNMARIADLVEGVEALVVVEVVSTRAVPLRNRRSMC